MTNSADPDQLASLEASCSGSTLFAKIGHILGQQERVKRFLFWILPGFSAPQSPIDAPHGTPDSFTMSTGIQTRPKFSRRNSHAQSSRQSSRSGTERKTAGWQTLVLYAVNLSRLDVHVNMSNVMGNTV